MDLWLRGRPFRRAEAFAEGALTKSASGFTILIDSTVIGVEGPVYRSEISYLMPT
jgi:hypothetical protein